MAATSTFIHESNLYYGIFADIEVHEHVKATLAGSKKYKAILEDDGYLKAGPDTVYASFNSDSDEPSLYFLFIDEMTVGGDEFESSSDTFIHFEPTELVKAEQSHHISVDYLVELFNFLVKELKKKKVDLNLIHLGWSAVNCTWEDDETDSESEEEVVPPKKGKNPVQVAAIVPPVKKGARKPKVAPEPEPEPEPVKKPRARKPKAEVEPAPDNVAPAEPAKKSRSRKNKSEVTTQ